MSRPIPPRPQPTLLLFTLGPEADCERHPVLPPRLRAEERELRWRCTESILEAGRQCDFEIELATGRRMAGAPGLRRVEQRGDTFGERLVSAIKDCASRHPAAPLVLVGGDVPGLGRDHLEQALGQLHRDPEAVVIGPSPDGGFYLLGTMTPLDSALERVRWCGKRTRRDLIEALERQGRRVHLLEPLADLDRPSDLSALLRNTSAPPVVTRLVWRIRAALRAAARPLSPPTVSWGTPSLALAQPRRGPPA